MTKSPSTTIEEVASAMAAAELRATKGLREVSGAIAELLEAEIKLKALAASQTVAIVHEDRKPRNDESPRLAYRIEELVRAIGVSRSTIERRIADGTLKATKVFGVRLIAAESVRVLFVPED